MIRTSLSLTALMLSTSLVSAASQAEDAFDAYIKDINGSGLLSIDADTRIYNVSSDTLTVQNVVYKLEWTLPDDDKQPLSLSGKVTIPTMHLKGVKLAEDGFSYEEWKLDGYSIDFNIDPEGDEFDTRLTGTSLGEAVTVDGFTPFMGEFKIAPARPIGSTLDYFRPLILKTSYKSSSTNGFTLTTIGGDGSVEKTTYGPSIAKDLADGKLGSVTLESQTGKTTIPDPVDEDGKTIDVPGIPDEVTYEIGITSYEQLDIGAFAALLDPQMPGWDGKQTIMKKNASNGIKVSAGEAFNMSVDEAIQLDFEASRPSNFLVPLLDKLISEDKDMEDLPPEDSDKLIRASFDLMRAFSFGQGEANNLKFDLTVPDGDMAGQKIEASLAQIAMSGFDKNGIEEYSISDLKIAMQNQMSMRLGRAAIENLEFPEFSQVEKVVIDSMAGRDPSPSDIAKMAPHNLTIAVNDLEYQDQSNQMVKAKEIRTSYKTEGLAIPTLFSAKASGLSVSKNLVSHPLASVLMNQLGLETLDIDKEITLSWDEANETYKLSPLDIKLGGVARLAGSIGFGGIKRGYLDDPERNGPGAMATGTVLPSTLSLSDEGGLPELINLAGGMTGMGPEQVRSFASAQIQAMLAPYTRPDFAEAVAGQVKAFLTNPKRLEIAISPSAPVPVAQILGVAATAPSSIPDILGIGVFAVE